MEQKMPGRVCARISLGAVRKNFDLMRQCVRPGTRFCAVIKTDGYGHGAAPIAHMCEKWDDVWGYAVATAEEAFALRDDGIEKPVLILGYSFPEHYERMAEEGIRPAVFTREMAAAFSQAARRSGKTAPVHIAVDTGMSRIGVSDREDGIAEACAVAAMEGITVEGLFTHFARADEKDKRFAAEALHRFVSFRDRLAKKGICPELVHCANSAAILELPEADFDMVRAGITIYGIYPSDEMDRRNVLSPVMELISHVVHVKTVPEGTAVSYGGTYITKDSAKIATVPVGYGDGYPRSLSSRGCVLIRGKRCPIIGRVCMDQFMVDVTGMDVKTGDPVVLLGRDGEECITIDELSGLSGRFPYEFVCDIGKRVPRVYTES